ncbi:hypothetical protein EC973_007782 [Apophysomyces ossiformis]|uniref:Uncharacterized protein n=1 Tax=Apophysomyces ossiformis TaxID=679940 RepID=A0A8H7BZA3_9FUNG|nr:hypothetical protein EC973_007782 [Apophysomyces ossiformis]
MQVPHPQIRENKRKRKRVIQSNISLDKAIEALHDVFQNQLVTIISKELEDKPRKNTAKKARFQSEVEKQAKTNKILQELRTRLEKADRVPRTSLEQADDSINVTRGTIRRTLCFHYPEPASIGKLWRDYAAAHFNDAVAEARARLEEHGEVEEAGSSKEVTVNDDSKEEKEIIRTCSVRLSKILREDLDNQVKQTFLETIAITSEQATNYASELGTAVHATMLKYASGSVVLDAESKQAHYQQDGKTFNVLDVIHEEWIRHPELLNSELAIAVAPMPDNIKNYVKALPKKHNDEFLNLFTEAHLQFLHSDYFGRQSYKAQGKSFWSSLQHQGLKDLPKPPAGLSTVMHFQLKQYATDLQNMWAGGLFHKSINHLLRILLRINLASEREKKIQEITEKKLQEKEKQREESSRTMRRKKEWRRRKIKGRLKQERKSLRRLEKRLGIEMDGNQRANLLQRKKSCVEAIRRLEKQAKEKYRPKKADNQPHQKDEEARGDMDKLAISADISVMDDEGIEETIETAIEEAQDELEEVEIKTLKKEPSRRRLIRIQAITKKLLLSTDIDGNVQASDVSDIWNDNDELQKVEIDIVVKLANALRPYVPKGRLSSAISLRLRFVLLSNAILHATGYSKFTANICPTISPASIHALPLDAASMYEMFGSNSAKFNLYKEDGSTIDNIREARTNKSAVIGSFFDQEKVKHICNTRGLEPRWRITITPHQMAVIDSDVKKGRVIDTSHYEERKKKSKGKRADSASSQFEDKSGLDIANITCSLEDAKQRVKALESAEKQIKNALRQREEVVESRMESYRRSKDVARRKVRDKRKSEKFDIYDSRAKQKQTDIYKDLKAAKLERAKSQSELSKIRSQLADQRRLRYIYQKQRDILKKQQTNKETKPKDDEQEQETKLCKVASWNRPGCEANTEFLDISELHQEVKQDPKKTITFGGTDYGLRTLATTVPVTMERARLHFDLYNRQFGDGQTPVSIPKEMSTLPKPMRITAGYLEEKTLCRSFRKKRERRKKNNPAVISAEKTLSKRSSASATTVEQVLESQAVKRNCRRELRAFYHSNRAEHEKRTQKLYTDRIYDQVAAQERKFIKAAATTQTDGRQKALPIMAIGTQGTGVGLRLKGHLKRGGKWLRKRHRRYVPVSMTNEHRSSQLCVYCFERVERAKARRRKSRQWKTVRVNGASQCVNPCCPAYQSGHATQNRDVQAAVAIGLASASNILSANRSTLTPFDPSIFSAGKPFVPGATNFWCVNSSRKLCEELREPGPVAMTGVIRTYASVTEEF